MRIANPNPIPDVPVALHGTKSKGTWHAYGTSLTGVSTFV
jgi:hypothetical protein